VKRTSGIGAPSGLCSRNALVLAAALALVLVFGVSVASAAAPVVAVNNASSVEYTTAHVSGEVDPQGQATIYRFQYVDQGTREFELAIGVSEWEFAETGKEATIEGAAQPVEADLTGLATNTTYYLRLIATNAEGSTEAVPASTFTTKAVAVPTVSIEAPTTIGATAHFTGHIEPNAPAGNPAAFDVNWQFSCNPECPGLSGGHITADNATHTVEADASGLLPGTAYEVTLSASNVGGTASAGPESFTTATVAPQITSPQASPHFTEARLSAQINPGGLQTTYHFEYGPTSTYGQSTPATVIPAGSSPVPVEANIATLSPSTEYHYLVVAENSIETVMSSDQRFTTVSRTASTGVCPNENNRVGLSELLPDCRAYEQVSPVQKNGFDAGAPSGEGKYAMATADGNGILYATRGPMGEANRGLEEYAVGLRTSGGWSSRSAVPPTYLERALVIGQNPEAIIPSSDLSKLLFQSYGTYVPENPDTSNLVKSTGIYLGHSDEFVEWLSKPLIANPEPAPGEIEGQLLQLVGGSPDLSTVYFQSSPTLLPSDASRAQSGTGGWGLYEYSGGTLRSAGTLPDGTEDPGGAAPASTSPSDLNEKSVTPEAFGNQVSRDGSTLWFVSPDPGRNPESQPLTELYVRRDGHSTLVSHALDGSPAPDGATPVETLNGGATDVNAHQYAYGSADGTAAIFQSPDVLAPGAPNDSSLKSYRYEVATNTVTYLPGVAGATIVAASDDDSRFLFGYGRKTGREGIGLWDDGTITTLASSGAGQVAPARATSDGSVFVFSTAASIGGANTGGSVQVYRYDVAQGEATCVSCQPQGTGGGVLANQIAGQFLAPRGMSSDGQRVFFQTSAALVPTDNNGQQDVYEWEPSGVSLISSGRSPGPSFLLDNSAGGDDVFFATSEGLSPADTDGGYDVYDARVNGGFGHAEQAPCLGEGCRGTPSSAPLFGESGSLTFSGPGNATSPVPAKPKSLTRAQKLSRALKTCHKMKAKRARALCEKKAHRAYGPPKSKSKAKSRKGGK
jgi:hypothetical protein